MSDLPQKAALGRMPLINLLSEIGTKPMPHTAAGLTPTPAIQVLVGSRFTYLTPVSKAPDDFCLMRVELQAGVLVPLHSHADRETFFILSGELQILTDAEWQTFQPGEVMDVAGGIRHAIRNASAESTTLLLVTTMKMGQFFLDVGHVITDRAPLPPTPAEVQRFVDVSNDYGYWLGSPEDNQAVGISIS